MLMSHQTGWPSNNDVYSYAIPNGQGYCDIANGNSGLCLDVISASSSSGAQIDQWTCNGGSNQAWKQLAA